MLYESYLPILIFLLIAIGLGMVVPLAGRIVAKITGADNPTDEKNSPFECGFPEFGDARLKFDVRFYLVAILFIVFDLEMAFMFPWAVVFTKIGWPGFISMMIFLVELFLGFIFLWKKGALEWE